MAVLRGAEGAASSSVATDLGTPERDDTRSERPPLIFRLYPALANRHYRLLWFGMLPGTIAWQMSAVAVPYAAFTLADSATVLGVVSLATGLPMLVLSLVGGVVADRFPRKRILVTTQLTLGLGAALLAALTLGGVLQVWHLVALGAVQGVAFSFNMPARQAYIAELVGRSLVRNAAALNNAGINFCRVAGPAVAGALLAVPAIGIGGVFVGMTVAYAIVLASLLRLPSGRGSAPTGGAHRGGNGWDELVEGLVYIRSSPVLLTLMGTGFLALFFGMPYQTLMPLFAERVFDVGAGGLGVLMAATGLGALAGSLLVASLSRVARPGLFQIGFGVGFGLALVCFALAPTFPLAVAALVLVGLLSSAYGALNNTLVLGNTEPRLYGRVMSVNLLTFATMPLGAFPMAWLADHIGGRPVITGAGLLVAVAVGGIAFFYPAYRRIR